jgi:2,3-bisphosphoglycerate-dependent phosphoglycerate mutase
VLIAAHGNSLRGLVKHLDGLCDDAVVSLNIPTGHPAALPAGPGLDDRRGARPLPGPEAAAAAIEAVANQGKR